MPRFDTIVIGGGSAGLAFAKKSARQGASCLLVEQEYLGGTCVNRGCVPKKLLWQASWDRVQQGVTGLDDVPVELGKLRGEIADKMRSIRDSFAGDLEEANVTLMRGTAEIPTLGDAVTINGETFETDHLVIATGAQPSPLEIEGGELAETSDDVLAWTNVPKRIVFLGGGYIGCELASIYSGFGSEVTIVDPGERLLTQFDADIVSLVEDIFARRGIDVRLESEPEGLVRRRDGYQLQLADGTTLTADKVVAAVGRTPNVEGLGELTNALDVAESGALQIDERFETSVKGVYAIGDAAARLPLTPVATRDGEALADILFSDAEVDPIDLSYVASAAFVMPPIAQVGGLDGGDLDEGKELISGVLVPEDHWSAQVARKVAQTDGNLRGAALMAGAAADMIAPFAALVAADEKDPLAAATGVHPTFGEETVGR